MQLCIDIAKPVDMPGKQSNLALWHDVAGAQTHTSVQGRQRCRQGCCAVDCQHRAIRPGGSGLALQQPVGVGMHLMFHRCVFLQRSRNTWLFAVITIQAALCSTLYVLLSICVSLGCAPGCCGPQ